MRLCLVIPTWNAGPLLEEVLAAVDRQPGAGELERVAVDSGSSDDTVAVLQRHGFAVHTIPQSEFNHGTTRDLAISKTSGEIILLLTQDATPADDNWLPRLRDAYQDERVAAAYCRQIPRPDCHPLIAQRILEWTGSRPDPVLNLLGDRKWDDLEPMERLQLCAYDNVAGSVRRSAWEQIPFGYRRFGEDVAFGKRLILAGHGVLYEPRATVIHSHNRTPKAEGKRIYCDHANLRELFDVHLIPTYDAYKRAVKDGQADFRRRIEAMDETTERIDELNQWAEQYAKWSALGIYLGGNSQRLQKGLRGAPFRWLDRRMRKGI